MNEFEIQEQNFIDHGYQADGQITCDGDPWHVHSVCSACMAIRYANGCIVTDCICECD